MTVNNTLSPTYDHQQRNDNYITNEEHITNLHVTNIDHEYFVNYLKIGTINIQGGYKNKITNIINYFVTHNYSILGLTETQLQISHDNNFIERYPHPTINNSFIYIILDANGENKGTGVGIMLTDNLYKHVHKIVHHKGRILHAKLGFKKHQTLSITCLYLPADRSKQSNHIKKDCNNFIDTLHLSQNTNNKHRLYEIIMGDFNCHPKEKTNLNYYIIQLAKTKGLKDMAKYHATNNTPAVTRTTHRIDYIFGNEQIMDVSIHTFTQQIPPSHFTSDHKAVITLLEDNLFNIPQSQSRYNNNKLKEKPDYTQMNDEKWEDYKIKSRLYFSNRFKYLDILGVNNQEDLDHIWNIFEQCINQIKKSTIPHKKISRNNSQHTYPLHIRQLNNHVINVYKTKQFFNLKHIYIRNKITHSEDNQNGIRFGL
ncbi:DNase I-like protein [Rhizophagus irregularis]|nr:DNase I-like protein [Rhizophagus irregularis]